MHLNQRMCPANSFIFFAVCKNLVIIREVEINGPLFVGGIDAESKKLICIANWLF